MGLRRRPGAGHGLDWPPLGLIATGSALALLGMGYIVLRGRLELPKKNAFTGALIVTEGKNNTVAVDGYKFSKEITRYFSGLSENKALRDIWQNGDLSDFQAVDGTAALNGSLTPAKLVQEAIEYFALRQLSFHLSGHFENNPDIVDEGVQRFGREDIPKILLQNHFLELFSKPMVEREAFSKDVAEASDKVVFQMKHTGEMFDHFELILPSKSEVTRIDRRTISIDTKRFTIRISSGFEGYGFNLPTWFEPMYLGTKIFETRAYKTELSVSVNYKLSALLSLKGWSYYRWIDSYLDRLDASFSFDRFLDKSGWETACTVARIFKRRRPPQTSGDSNSLPGVVELISHDSDQD